MSKQENRQQRIYDLFKTKTKQKFLCLLYTKLGKFFTEKELFKEMGEWRVEQKTKRRLFNCSCYGELEEPYNFNKKAC